MGYLGSIPGLGKSPEEGKGYPLQYPGLENSMDCIVHRVAKSWTRMSDFHVPFSGSPDSSGGKEFTCKAGDPGLISGSGRSSGEGKGYPLQYSGLENSMDCGVTKSQTQLSDFHFSI